MLPRLLELVLFGVLPFVFGSVATSGSSQAAEEDSVLEEKVECPGRTATIGTDPSSVVIKFPPSGNP